MSNQTFPSLPGVDIAVEREAIYSTTVHTSASGTEQRASWQSSPRYHYTLAFTCLRDAVNAPATSTPETQIILNFLDQHKGSFDSFLYTDPFDGSTKRVRFVADSLVYKREVMGIWSVSQLELITAQ